MRHLFFYGPSGAGKSFALRRALRDCHPGRVAGFCTHKSRSGGVYLLSLIHISEPTRR